jgi:ABC-type Fe3+/spermidine/putrescine transport system ATPase subunit
MSLGASKEGSVVLEGVTKRFGAHIAVEDFSIAIAPGQFFTIIGASGSGKSTTLAMIAGFEFPDTGRVLLRGQDTTYASPRDRNLSMVFQNYAIFPHLDVHENVAFPLRARRVDRDEISARVSDALSLVRLDGLEKRYASQLSGGQQQRVALARAIVGKPDIVLMDEPLGALDKNLRFHMQSEIKAIQRRLGMTVIFVTHDQEEAMNLSDRIAIMEGGQLVQEGPPRDVYERPDSVLAAKFLGESNLIAGTADGSMLTTPGGRILHASNRTKGQAMMFVRPEKLTLTHGERGAIDGQNSLVGSVSAASFLGNVLRIEIDAGEGLSLVVDAANGRDAPSVAVGDAVTAAWSVSDSRLLIV